MTKLLNAPLYAVSPEWEYNGYDDSDFYRVMYDPNTSELKRVQTWSTRYARGWHATVSGEYARRNNLGGYRAHEYKRDFDGHAGYVETVNVSVPLPVRWYVPETETPERVWELAAEKYAAIIFESFKVQSALKARQPGRGKMCRVIAGRKIKKGETVQALGEPERDLYKGHDNGWRVLVRTAAGTLKTNLRNLEVIAPEQFETPETELREKARAIAAEAREQKSFYGLFRTSSVSMV